MKRTSFVIAGSAAAVIANDGSDFRYHAALMVLPVDGKAEARTNQQYETQFLVEAGTVEFMIGGGTGISFAGDFVRVPPGIVHACRNMAEDPARVLVRHISPVPVQRAARVCIDFAA